MRKYSVTDLKNNYIVTGSSSSFKRVGSFVMQIGGLKACFSLKHANVHTQQLILPISLALSEATAAKTTFQQTHS